MRLHRLFTVLALCAILFSTAVPAGTVTAVLDPGAVLEVTITPDPSFNTAGQALGFTITVVNTSPNLAKDVVVKDQLDPAMTWQADHPGCSISAGGLLACALGDLPGGESMQVQVAGDTPELLLCSSVRTDVTAQAANGDTAKAKTILPMLGCYPLLSMQKTAAAEEVPQGQPISFTLLIRNTGGIPAENVVVRDTLPVRPGLNWSIAAPVPAGCQITAGELICNVGTFPHGTSRSVTLTSPTGAGSCGVISNSAVIESSNEPQFEWGNNTSTAEVNVTCPPEETNVSISKVAEEDTVPLDGLVQFTVSVSNPGSVAAQNVTLTDVLPSTTGLAWSIDTPVPPECAIVAGVLTCEFGTLEAGASRSVRISSTAGAGSCGLVSNTATVSATGELEENLTDNTANASVSVACDSPVLEVVKVADAGMVNAPGAIGYTITINNTGSVPATDVTLEDQLASALDWSETSGADCSFSETQLMTCSIPSIAAGESISVHVTASTNTEVCGEVSNTAYAVAANHDQVTSNPVVVDVLCGTGVNVKITKTAQKPVVNQGEPIIFTMLVLNDGAETAQGVVLKDTLPTVAGLAWSIVAPVPSGCAIAANTLTCNFGAMEPAQSREVQITSPSNNTAGVISNTAIVTATNESAGNEADNQSTAQVQVPIAACVNLNLFNGVYANTFEGAQPGKIGIQNYRQSVAPKGQQFLGDYGNQTVSLTVGCLPPHNRLLVEFDLYILRSWDGNTPNTGPDRWKMELVGRNTPLVDTTFSNWSWSRQAYPGSYPTGNFPYLTGSVGRQTLGYIYDGYRKDTTYHLSMFVEHTGELATFNFTGLGLQQLADESWGIDNITVVPAGLNTLFIPDIRN